MKKFLLLVTAFAFAFLSQAQNYDAAKNLMILQQYRKAKEEVDKGMSNAKYTSKPEAYILKASIYGGLAQDKTVSTTPEAEQLISEAEKAFAKYREMDPSLTLMKDAVYQNAPVNIYSSLYSSGYKDYEKKNWQSSYDKFKKVVDYADLMIKEKILSVPVDTNGLILAGITAESSDHKDDAAKYYSRLADLKLSGEGYESLYRFLVNYYFSKNDIASFEKYKELGKQLYPKSEYFDYDKVDFAVGLVDDFNKKLSALDQMIASDPSSYKAYEVMGELIYDTLNPRKEGVPLPANADELEKKMITAFTKASELKPESELPYLYMADHYINKSNKINDARAAFVEEMKKRTKPGTAASKEDIAKRDALDEQYGNSLELARVPYEKAAELLGKKATLSNRDKQQYKKAAGYLSDIYGFKKGKSKSKPADLAKYTAEEKKWNDLYESIKQ